MVLLHPPLQEGQLYLTGHPIIRRFELPGPRNIRQRCIVGYRPRCQGTLQIRARRADYGCQVLQFRQQAIDCLKARTVWH